MLNKNALYEVRYDCFLHSTAMYMPHLFCYSIASKRATGVKVIETAREQSENASLQLKMLNRARDERAKKRVSKKGVK